MEEMTRFKTYEQYKKSLDEELSRAAEGFVRIGYLLKVARDTNILYESGYGSVTQFAEAEYHLRPDQVTRFIQINDRFSENGYGTKLEQTYSGMGYTKLVEMLQLPEIITQEITPDFTRDEIKELRNEVEEEQKITDLEVLMENKEWDGEIPILQQVIIQLGHDELDWYRRVYEWKNAQGNLQEFKWVMDPTGASIYSVRVRGTGKFLLSVKEKEESAVLIHVRTQERETVLWETIRKIAEDLIEPGTMQESWQQVYGETLDLPEEHKEENVPEKTKKNEEKPKKIISVTRKEDRKPKEKNIEQRKEANEKCGSDSERIGTEQSEKPEEKQMGNRGKTTKIAPEQSEEKPLGTRKQYMDGLTEYGAGEYLASHIRKLVTSAEKEEIGKGLYWEKWFSEDVDILGNRWEYEEEETKDEETEGEEKET